MGKIDVDMDGYLKVRGSRRALDLVVGSCCGRWERGGWVSIPPSLLALQRIQELCKIIGVRVEISPRVQAWQERWSRLREIMQEPVDVDGGRLYPHQLSFARRLTVIPYQFAADETGTGKTVSALAGAVITASRRVLVICPSVALYQWEDHVREWTTLEPWVLERGSRRRRERTLEQVMQGNDWVLIMNWEALVPYYAQLQQMQFDMIIADEFHFARNRKARRTQALTGCHGRHGNRPYKGLRAKYKIGLSGTPFEKSGADLWPWLYWIWQDGAWSSYWRTAQWFCDVRENRWGGIEVKGLRDPDIFTDALAPFLRRVTLEDVAEHLPPVVTKLIPLEPSEAHRKFYRQQARLLRGENPFAAIMRLRRLAVDPRTVDPSFAGELVKWEALEEILKETPHCVVFGTLLGPLEELAKEYGGFFMRGDTPEAERKRILRRFQKGGRLFMTPQLGGTGLDFPHCNHAVFLDLPWSYTLYRQAVGRVRRISSVGTVVITVPYLKGTIEERILEVLEEKEELNREALAQLVESHLNEL